MTSDTLNLFYAYANEDEKLLKKLNKHLSLLVRQGLISPWSSQEDRGWLSQYRELYKENLKRDLPHIPLLLNSESFEACVSIGRQLMKMHVEYEQEDEYPLQLISDKEIPYLMRLRVEKMKLSPDKTALVYSKGLTLEGIPAECFEYRLGNRSALEWIIDQYQVSIDKRSGIESDPNRLDDPQYILRLIKQVITVSVKTVELVKELAEAVSAEDWLGEAVDVGSEPSALE